MEHHKAWIVHTHKAKAGFVTREINILPGSKAVGHRTLKPMGFTLPYLFINFIVDYYWSLSMLKELNQPRSASKELVVQKRKRE